MPEEDTPKPKSATVTAEEEPIVDAAELNKPQKIIESASGGQAVQEIQSKIDAAENILVALSNDPSVDEIAAAIGLTIALNKLGKHATAIYSGVTPNVLQFLEPEKTFDDNPDVLQDLIIALNKDKADHLRYKVDGDYVKIFVTPYKTKIVPEDLDYSYGDYNVDLVIALDVHTAVDLDSVLRKHGRIMHDATAINMTTTLPGRFADVEWSDTTKSSVSEMVADLLMEMKKPELDAEIATPLLAGIVAETERFKNEHTGAETMRVAGRLMEAGANAQLVAENVSPDDTAADAPTDMSIEVQHEEVEPEPEAEPAEEEATEEVELPPVEPTRPVDAPILNAELMEELRRQQEEANAPVEEEPVQENVKDYGKMIDEALAELNGVAPAEPAMETATPAAGEAGVPEAAVVGVSEATVPEAAAVGVSEATVPAEPVVAGAENNVAAEAVVPEAVASEPVVQGAPDLPMPSDEILPPPPAPEVDFAAGAPEMPTTAESTPAMDAPEMPTVAENAPAGDALAGEVIAEMPITEAPAEEAPVAEAAVANNNPTDPSEFKIPGM